MPLFLFPHSDKILSSVKFWNLSIAQLFFIMKCQLLLSLVFRKYLASASFTGLFFRILFSRAGFTFAADKFEDLLRITDIFIFNLYYLFFI